MAGVDWGTAIAQGVMGGLGDAGQRYFADQRRQKMQDKKFKQQTKAFQDNALFQQNLKTIEQQRDNDEQWRKAAQMGTTDLAFDVAKKTVAGLPKDMQAKALRTRIKSLNKKSHAELMALGGYVKGDYSEYADDPRYADAIPKATVTGGGELPGMDRKFQAPDLGSGEEAVPLKQWQFEQQSRIKGYKDTLLSNRQLNQVGIKNVDSSVLNMIDQDLQYGKQDMTYVDETTGQTVNRAVDSVVTGLQNGTLTELQGTVMSTYKAEQLKQFQQEQGLESEGAPMQGEGSDAADSYGDLAATESDIAEYKGAAKEEKRVASEATDVAKMIAKENITGVVDQVDRAKDTLKSLEPAALDFVYSALNETDGNVRKAADVIRKNEDPMAVEGAKALQSLMAVLNVELKDRSGAAVTDQEAERFFQEMGRASAVGSLEETLNGLDNLAKQKMSKVEAALQGRDESVVQRFFETSPKYQEYFEEDERYGTEEGKQRASLRAEIKDQAQALLDANESPEEVNQFLTETYGEEAKAMGLNLPQLSNE